MQVSLMYAHPSCFKVSLVTWNAGEVSSYENRCKLFANCWNAKPFLGIMIEPTLIHVSQLMKFCC